MITLIVSVSLACITEAQAIIETKDSCVRVGVHQDIKTKHPYKGQCFLEMTESVANSTLKEASSTPGLGMYYLDKTACENVCKAHDAWLPQIEDKEMADFFYDLVNAGDSRVELAMLGVEIARIGDKSEMEVKWDAGKINTTNVKLFAVPVSVSGSKNTGLGKHEVSGQWWFVNNHGFDYTVQRKVKGDWNSYTKDYLLYDNHDYFRLFCHYEPQAPYVAPTTSTSPTTTLVTTKVKTTATKPAVMTTASKTTTATKRSASAETGPMLQMVFGLLCFAFLIKFKLF